MSGVPIDIWNNFIELLHPEDLLVLVGDCNTENKNVFHYLNHLGLQEHKRTLLHKLPKKNKVNTGSSIESITSLESNLKEIFLGVGRDGESLVTRSGKDYLHTPGLGITLNRVYRFDKDTGKLTPYSNKRYQIFPTLLVFFQNLVTYLPLNSKNQKEVLDIIQKIIRTFPDINKLDNTNFICHLKKEYENLYEDLKNSKETYAQEAVRRVMEMIGGEVALQKIAIKSKLEEESKGGSDSDITSTSCSDSLPKAMKDGQINEAKKLLLSGDNKDIENLSQSDIKNENFQKMKPMLTQYLDTLKQTERIIPHPELSKQPLMVMAHSGVGKTLHVKDIEAVEGLETKQRK